MPTDDLDAFARSLAPAYRVEREIPRGGMSRLFLARDMALDRLVVVKVLPHDLVNAASLARFRREIELTVQLQHPHILPVLAAGSAHDLHYYVTPFVPGESLRERIAEGGPLPMAEVRRIALELTEALAFAHSRGVIHRDVKPGNILMLEGSPMIADFGIARAMSGNASTPSSLTMPGTPGYMAPEQPQNEAADLYALGVVVYEMLTSSRPVGEVTARALRRQRKSRDSDSQEFDQLAAVVVKMLAANPAERFSTASDVLTALSARPSWRSRRLRVGVMSGVILALGSVATAWTVREYEQSTARALGMAESNLSRGDLSAATSFARRAVILDSTSVRARLVLGRLLSYDGSDSTTLEAVSAFRFALSHGIANPHDSAQAEGFLALATNDQSRACHIFSVDSSSYPHDFDTLFGLGECRRRDRAVVASPTSPTGLAFRGSYHSAAKAYESALTVSRWPSPEFVYKRLREVLFTETNRLRTGTLADGRRVMAYPSLSGDTIAFLPEEPSNSGHGLVSVPASRPRALDYGTARLRKAYTGWVKSAPANASAHRALSEILEEVGNITESGIEEVTALDEIRKARSFVDDSLPLLVCIQIRQLIRSGRLAAAHLLADSALRRWPEATRARSSPMAGLAALTGRVSKVIEYGRDLSGTPRHSPALDGAPINLPLELRHMRADLIARASIGICDSTTVALATALTRAVMKDYPDLANQPRAQLAVLERPLTLAITCLGPASVAALPASRDPLISLQRALALGQSGIAGVLRTLGAARALERPSDVTYDYVVSESQLLANAGDTAAARDRLERALAALPSVSSSALLQVPIVAGWVRAMALQARLAAKNADSTQARLWAGNVVTLWGEGDPELRPVVDEMRSILRGGASRRAER